MKSPLKPLDEALAELAAAARPLARTERIPTLEADGRVLAEDLVSALQVPPADNSAMDGYAVRVADLVAGAPLPVSQRIAAGGTAQALAAGSVARIFTGAAVPPGADAVVMQEECEALPGEPPTVRVLSQPQPGQHIRKAGEDVALGATVLRKGELLKPSGCALAASLGYGSLRVAGRPRVALLSTGDELVMPGEVPPEAMPAGAVYNSNRFFLVQLLRRAGCDVTDLGRVPDRREATEAALAAAAPAHDLILTSGGVSVGEEDHVKPAVQALGELALWQVAIKPGKPFAFGRVAQTHFIGLPGNPVSSFITFLLLVAPFVRALAGATGWAPRGFELPAHFDWPRPDRRREFLRVRLDQAGGLVLFPNQGSGVLTSMAWADGLVDNPPGRAIGHGDRVRFVPMSQYLE